jgi:hypothetical protein
LTATKRKGQKKSAEGNAQTPRRSLHLQVKDNNTDFGHVYNVRPFGGPGILWDKPYWHPPNGDIIYIDGLPPWIDGKESMWAAADMI